MIVRRAFLVTLCLASFASAGEFAERRDHNWHQWRGPRADGVALDGDPPIAWDEQTNVRWKVEIPGEGSGTPIVWEDRVFLLAAIETDRVVEPAVADPTAKTQPPERIYQFEVLCLDRATGEVLWRRTALEAAPHEGRHATNSYASASAITDGTRLYAPFGSRGVYCYDLDGNLIWKRELGRLTTRFGWGEGATPALHGESLVVTCDQEQDSFVAVLDAATGEERWRAERDEPTSWATPLIVEHRGRVQAIVNGTNRVRSYDLASGEVIWECGGQTVNAIPSPLAANGVAICMSGYKGAAAFAIPLDSAGDITDNGSVFWSVDQGTPYVPSPILYEGRLYFTASNTPVLSCLDAATGSPVFERQRLEGLGDLYASPAAAAGRIYFVDRNGATTVIASGDELKVLATNQLDDGIDASPVIVGKQLFLRGKKFLYCIEDQAAAGDAEATRSTKSPLEKAVAFLARETPKWSAENGCYSCHNNGDAARALYAARVRGMAIAEQALADTTAWLNDPSRWEHNGGEGEFNEQDLAAIQFASALVGAREAGAVAGDGPLIAAAERVASFQESDGAWVVDAQATVGSPATYGSMLATAVSRRTLAAADSARFAAEIEKADRWLRGQRPKTVLAAAALLLGLGASQDAEAIALRKSCIDLISSGENPSGGWGPFVASSSEPFDTAIVVLALCEIGDQTDQGAIERGRRFLIDCQAEDGSWVETTRPPGAVSYAQRISTTAWATLALLPSS